MTQTTTSTNNKSIAFRGKSERERTKNERSPPARLRKQATQMRKRGMISDKVAKTMGMDE